MPAFAVHYRLTGYEPRSEQSSLPSEPDLLTPIAGAAHTDVFRYSTLPLAGYQPFIVALSGRKGRYSPLSKSTDIGQWQVQILDRKTATSQAIRHVTAFVGDALGRARLLGCKVFVEESVDGGATWQPFFTGRITAMQLDGPVVLAFTLRSMLADFKLPVFIGRPHASITYTAPPQYAPLGLGAAYGPVPAVAGMAMDYVSASQSFRINAAGGLRPENVLTDALRAAVPTFNFLSTSGADLVASPPTAIRARVAFTTGTFAGQTREYRVRGIGFVRAAVRGTLFGGDGNGDGIILVTVAPLASTSDPFYAVLPANGDLGAVTIVGPDTPPTTATPMRINDVHPVRLAEDLANGNFSYLNADGSVRRRVLLNTSSFTTLKNDTTFGVFRGEVTAKGEAKQFTTEQLGKIYGFGLRDNAVGEIEVFDARLPTSTAGLSTLTDADCYAGDPLEWEVSRDGAVTRVETTVYLERRFSAESAADVQGLRTPNDLISSTPYTESTITGFREDMGEEVVTLDLTGHRWFESETLQGRRREDVVRAAARRLVDEVRGPYGSGPMQIRVRARRTATVAGLAAGSICLVTLSQLPDPATNQRGGTRLMRVLERSEQGLAIEMALLDLGPSTVAVTPTIGVLAAGGDPSAEIAVPVTLNAAGNPVQLEVAITDTSVGALGSVPAAAWQVAQVVEATGTVTVGGLPSGRRVWVRGRAIGTGGTFVRIPSAYVSPATAFRDTTAPSNPTGLAVITNTSNLVVLGWNAGPASAQVQVAWRLQVLAPWNPQPFVTLAPGSTRCELRFDFSPTTTEWAVRFIDRFGGSSAWINGTNFLPAGAPPVAPTPTSLVVL